MYNNSVQREAINYKFEPLLILAPPGTGKTYILSQRIYKAVQKGIRPDEVLCLTFTNRAALSARNTIEHSLNNLGNMFVGTIHSFCNNIIKSEHEFLGLTPYYVIFGEEDSIDIIKKHYIDFSNYYDVLFYVSKYKLSALQNKEETKNISASFFDKYNIDLVGLCHKYNNELSLCNALDFSDLILNTISLFNDEKILSKWKNKYRFIEVDEIQDISIYEYSIISKLAQSSRNITLLGDINQTIYEWRDSKPLKIINEFRKEFSPKELFLNTNYRNSNIILEASNAILKDYYEPQQVSAINRSHNKIEIYEERNIYDEARRISGLIKECKPDQNCAVLTRKNISANILCRELTKLNIPCFNIEEYKFYRQAEIKDSLSALKIVLNQSDNLSLYRLISRVRNSIGIDVIKSLEKTTQFTYLTISDFLQFDEDTLDPYSDLIEAYYQNKIVVFDVETTGLNTGIDEIIELAAIKCGVDGVVETYHQYTKNTVPVGESIYIHGYSDDFLKQKGIKISEALYKFQRFYRQTVLIGHNISFDLEMLQSNCYRSNIKYLKPKSVYDTLSISRRVIKDVENYKLITLYKHLGLDTIPNHQAKADVRSTFELLRFLIGKLEDTSESRIKVFREFAHRFKTMRTKLKLLYNESLKLRPYYLAKKALNQLGIIEIYKSNNKAYSNIKELLSIIEALDNISLSPYNSIQNIMHHIALSGDSNKFFDIINKLPVITVHQAKGLEFDTVIIACASDIDFPSEKSVKHNFFKEELRLFYVALTRASNKVIITYHRDEGKKELNLSPFIKMIPCNLIEYKN